MAKVKNPRKAELKAKLLAGGLSPEEQKEFAELCKVASRKKEGKKALFQSVVDTIKPIIVGAVRDIMPKGSIKLVLLMEDGKEPELKAGATFSRKPKA